MSEYKPRDAADPNAGAPSRALVLWTGAQLDLFTPRELERLTFLRWLYLRGRLTEFP